MWRGFSGCGQGGSRVVDRAGSQVVDRGSRFVDRGSQVVDRGSQVVARLLADFTTSYSIRRFRYLSYYMYHMLQEGNGVGNVFSVTPIYRDTSSITVSCVVCTVYICCIIDRSGSSRHNSFHLQYVVWFRLEIRPRQMHLTFPSCS